MLLLNVTRHDGYLIIHTDKGIKRKKFNNEDISELERTYRSLIGSEIYHTTWAGWDHQHWFDEIFPVKESTSQNKS